MPSNIEVAIYRVAQEALNNIIKHAQANQVSVTLTRNDEVVGLEVGDDGVGFDPQTIISQGGMGLKGMQERANQINGKLWVQSIPEHGTQVKLEVPI